MYMTEHILSLSLCVLKGGAVGTEVMFFVVVVVCVYQELTVRKEANNWSELAPSAKSTCVTSTTQRMKRNDSLLTGKSSKDSS